MINVVSLHRKTFQNTRSVSGFLRVCRKKENIFPTGFITVYITTLRFLSLNETGNQIIVKTQSLLYKHMHVQLFW